MSAGLRNTLIVLALAFAVYAVPGGGDTASFIGALLSTAILGALVFIVVRLYREHRLVRARARLAAVPVAGVGLRRGAARSRRVAAVSGRPRVRQASAVSGRPRVRRAFCSPAAGGGGPSTFGCRRCVTSTLPERVNVTHVADAPASRVFRDTPA